MKRKNTLKSIIAIALCIIIALTAANPLTASAATKKVPIKVTFKGKTVTIVKDIDKGGTPKIKTLKSKWGSKPKTYDMGSQTEYEWVKGNSFVTIRNDLDKKGYASTFHVVANDKNGAVCGIKTGMTKEKAIKKLDAAFGKKYTIVNEYSDGSMDVSIGKRAYLTLAIGEDGIYSISLTTYK